MRPSCPRAVFDCGRPPRRGARWLPRVALLACLCATDAQAHLIDEIAESLLCDIETTDRTQIRATWYLEAARVEAYFDAAAQAGLAPERSAAGFARQLAEGFTIEGCDVRPAEPAEIPVPGRAGYRGFSLQIRCREPRTSIRLQRVDVSRERTRATLYVSLRVAGAPVRRFLLPPRLAALDVPLLSSGAPRGEAKAVHADEDDDEPLVAARTPADEIDTSKLPAPGETAGVWQRMPPASILVGWAREGVDHLAGGLDHLLFLAALALAARGLGVLGLLVAAFSLGHMLTMTWAIAAAWPRLVAVEVAIGVTICWSAWQAGRPALSRSSARLAIGAAASGLIHGAAFGAELRSVLGSSDGLLWPVLSFGVGLDLAQTLVAAAVFALWTPVRRGGDAEGVAARAGAAGIGALPTVAAVRTQRLAAGALVAAGLGYALRGLITAA